MAAGLGGSQLAGLCGAVGADPDPRNVTQVSTAELSRFTSNQSSLELKLIQGFSPWITLESFLPLLYPCKV